MAIDMKEFTQKVDVGLKANKSYTRFFYRFKVGTVAKRGLIDYTNMTWDKKERVAKAKAEKIRIAEGVKCRSAVGVVTTIVNAGKSPTLNDAADMYFSLKATDTAWATERETLYNLYCRNKDHKDFNVLGKVKLDELLIMHLDMLRKRMELGGLSKQTKDGCSVRTLKKLFVQTITPILKYAKENKLVNDYPVMTFEKMKRKKKKVTGGTQKLTMLFKVINDLYFDDPFYRALFLFSLFGRRWGEVKTLHWEDINFLDNTYTVLAERNKIDEDQTYELTPSIVTALLQIKDKHTGLVFKSPITGKELFTPKKQLAKIKDASGIQELTMHYFRHILVTAMGEAGTANTVLSASLGHTNMDTVNDFYLSASHTKASATANKVIEGIVK